LVIPVTPFPEACSMSMIAAGLGLVGLMFRRRKTASQA